jgi:hypothetical protein
LDKRGRNLFCGKERASFDFLQGTSGIGVEIFRKLTPQPAMNAWANNQFTGGGDGEKNYGCATSEKTVLGVATCGLA